MNVLKSAQGSRTTREANLKRKLKVVLVTDKQANDKGSKSSKLELSFIEDAERRAYGAFHKVSTALVLMSVFP